MKHFIAIILTALAFGLGTAGTAQARDHHYYSSRYSHSYSRGYCAPRYYSSGYCAPRYYSSGYCAPRYYVPSGYCAPRYYSSYGYGGYCAPRYYYGSGISIGLPGIGIHFGRY
jgi:hypothetical protein